MYIYPKKPNPIIKKIIHLPKSRLERFEDQLIEIKRGFKDFIAAAPSWEWVLSAVILFGVYAYFHGYYLNFWRSFNPLYR